jgi:hypothetical protein
MKRVIKAHRPQMQRHNKIRTFPVPQHLETLNLREKNCVHQIQHGIFFVCELICHHKWNLAAVGF